MPEIELGHGLKSLIDEEDMIEVAKYKWCAFGTERHRYAQGRVNGKTISLHRFLMKVSDSKVLVDHINGNGLDNRKSNMRLTNKAGNARNISKPHKYKGIWFHKKNKNWCADIKVNYKKIGLGSFKDEKDAAHAYNEAALKYFGEFANLNNIQG